MNNKQAKKLRKELNGKIIGDYEDLLSTVQTERLIWRIVIAIRIIFKWNPEKIKFRVKTEKTRI